MQANKYFLQEKFRLDTFTWKIELRTRPKNEVAPQLRNIALLSDEARVLNRTTLEMLSMTPYPSIDE